MKSIIYKVIKQYLPAICGTHPDNLVLWMDAGNRLLELEIHVHLKDILWF